MPSPGLLPSPGAYRPPSGSLDGVCCPSALLPVIPLAGLPRALSAFVFNLPDSILKDANRWKGTTFSSVPLPAPGLSKTTEGSEGPLFGIENQKASYLKCLRALNFPGQHLPAMYHA